MKKFSDEEVKDAEVELAKVRKDWLLRPGVTAVDVGYKIAGGQMQDEVATGKEDPGDPPVKSDDQPELPCGCGLCGQSKNRIAGR